MAPGVARDETTADGPLRTLGKFAILEQIGEGGMARIFLARSRGIGGFQKLVVIKQVLPRLAADAEFVARFLQEARLSASLDHPNIAAVHEVGEDPAGTYFAMEYVRGRDLHKILRRAKACGRMLQFDEILAVTTALCAGLHHAHTHVGEDGRPLGIVHRDVSPSNVLVSFDGAVKLADFGVAKVRSAGIETEAGTLRGKIAYMSPEQCRGEALDRRSDVFAAGVLLWELITGVRMRTGDSDVALVRQIADGDAPSPRGARPDVPEALERIVMHALARDPACRFPSAQALQLELEDFAHEARLVISPRTIATMMRVLFAEEIERESSDVDHARTIALRQGEQGEPTPATATVPPVAAKVPASTSEVRRRSWTPIALGVVAGVLLGGGGLYLALRDPDLRVAAPPSIETAVPSEPRAPATPRVAAEAPRTVAPAPDLTPPVAAQPMVEAPRKGTARRAKRKAASMPKPPIDLDAPLPPGSKPR